MKLSNIRWLEDDMGEYWVANFEDEDGNRGVTGNYYDRETMPEDTDQPLVPGHELGCKCEQCGKEWLRANLGS